MITFFRKLILRNIKVIAKVYSYKTHVKLNNYKNSVYSYWLKNFMKKSGEHLSIHRPSYFKGLEYMTFGENFSSGNNLRIECWDRYEDKIFLPQIIIGNNVIMNNNVHIGCINKIIIGDNVLFASNIYVTDHQHGYIDSRDLNIAPVRRSLSTRGPVIIEDNVWIGENVSIMPNVIIGKGSIIGANSVVTKNCPPNSIMAGVPAKVLRNLYEK